MNGEWGSSYSIGIKGTVQAELPIDNDVRHIFANGVYASNGGKKICFMSWRWDLPAGQLSPRVRGPLFPVVSGLLLVLGLV